VLFLRLKIVLYYSRLVPDTRLVVVALFCQSCCRDARLERVFHLLLSIGGGIQELTIPSAFLHSSLLWNILNLALACTLSASTTSRPILPSSTWRQLSKPTVVSAGSTSPPRTRTTANPRPTVALHSFPSRTSPTPRKRLCVCRDFVLTTWFGTWSGRNRGKETTRSHPATTLLRPSSNTAKRSRKK
jgi:hypothetical protein